MSTTIDSRVAELRFDNSHFEKNVSTTMSTLDKLKQKLNLTGASKGLENLGTTARKIDMSPLAKGVETVHAKFSALQVMGITALSNITNQAVNAGKRIAASLTIDPIKTGFSEYELKMGSIQTIMASTGEELETVNEYLNELNEYSDKTIYSFSDMTQNIGKFTNAGVKLEDAVMAIKGISNEAAVSGANANEASRAMYNFAQALSAGYVKLIDWKSIENANMATVEFKNQLLEAAVAAGTVQTTSDGMYKVLTKNTQGGSMDGAMNATKLFNESLNYQWMTTEVLVNTLRDYADETTDIGKKATQAATEVKTFSQMMDSLKESAQSGWAQTWEIVFGDFYEGKKLWTSLYNTIDKILGKIADTRNALLKSLFNSKWDQLVEKVNAVGISTEKFSDTIISLAREANLPIDDWIKEFGSLADVVKKGKIPAEIFRKAIKKLIGAETELSDSTSAVTKTVENLDEVVNRVMRGEFGNAPVRYQKLTEAGYDWATVQNKVNEIMGSSVRHVSDLTEAQKAQMNQLAKLDDETLKNKGYTEDQIEAIRELQKAAEGAGGSINDLINSMERPSGRELLFESFRNIWEFCKEVFGYINEAWKEVFGDISTEQRAEGVYGLIETLHELSESLSMTEEDAEKFKNIMVGVFSGIQLSWSLASASVVGILKIASAVLELFGTDLLSAMEWVALKIRDLNKWVDDIAFFGSDSKWADFGKAIHAILMGLKKCLDALFGLEKFAGVAKRFKQVIADIFDFDIKTNFLSIENVVDAINNFFGKIENWIKGIDSAENVGLYIVEGLAKGIWSGIKLAGEAILGIGKFIWETICGFFGIASPSKLFMQIGKFCIEGLFIGFRKVSASSIVKTIVGIGKMILKAMKDILGIHSPSTKFQEIGKNCIDGFILGFKNSMTAVGNFLKNFGENCVKIIQKIDWGKMLSIGLSVGLIYSMKKLSDALNTFISPFAAVGKGIGSLLTNIGQGLEAKFKAEAMDKKAGAILKIAIAIGVLVAAVVVLTKIPVGTLWASIGALVVLSGILVGLSIACSKLNEVGEFRLSSLSLLAIGGAMLMLAGMLKILSTIDFASGMDALGYLAGIVIAMGAFIVAIGQLVKGDVAQNINKVGKMMTKMAFALLLMVGVIKIASKLDEAALDQGLRVIWAIEILFAGIIAVASLVKGDAKKVGQMLLRMSFALLIMVGVIKVASMLDGTAVEKGFGVVAAVSLLFAGLIAVSYFAGENASKAGTMLLKISTALLIMVGVIKLAAGLSTDEIKRGLSVIAAFGGLVAGLVAVSYYAGQHASSAGTMLLKVAVAMLIMTAVLIILKELDPKGIGKAMGIIAGISAIFAGLIYVSKYAKDADKVKGTIITLTVAIGVLALALVALSLLDPKNVAVASAALSSTIGMFALLVKMTEHLKSGKKTWKRNLGTILILTLVVAALAAVIYQLSTIPNPDSAVKVAGALSLMLLAMVTSLEIISKSKSFTKGKLTQIMSALGVLAGVMIVLAVIIGALTTHGKNAESAIPYAIALSGMIYVMSLVIQNLSSLDGRKTKGLTRAVGCLALLAGVMGLLGGILVMMSALNPQSVIPNALALSSLIIILTGVAVVLGKLNASVATLSTGALGLTMLAGVLALLGLVLAMMSALGVKDAMTNALALSMLIGVLTGVCAAIAVIGVALPTIATGALGLAMLAGVLALVGLVLAMMTALDVKDAMANAAALSILLLAMSAALAILSVAGAAWPAALAGIGCLAAFVVAMGALIAGIGALVSEFPQLEQFLDKGIPILVKIGAGLGEFFGAIVGGFIGGVGVALPILGRQLSQFMVNVQPFIVGAKLVNDKVLAGVGILVASVLALTIADLLNNVGLLLGVSLPMLGLELSMFMKNALPFIIGAMAITPTMLEGVKMLAETVLILTGAGLLEGISRFLLGGSSIETFSKQLPILANGLKGFVSSLGSVTDEQLVSAKNAAEIIKTLAKAASDVPNAGGLLGTLVGENDMGPWSEQLPTMAEGVVAFTQTIAQAKLTDDSVAMANKAAEIIKTLSKAAAEIPNGGGKLAEWIGDNNLSTWAAQLPIAAGGIVGFCNALIQGGISGDQVEIAKKAASIINVLASAAAEIPNGGGKLAEWIGDNDLSTWAAQLPKVGTGVAGFAKNLGTFDEAKLATVKAATDAVKVIASMANNVSLGIVDADDFTVFGTAMVNLAVKVKEFADKMVGIKAETVTAAIDQIYELIDLATTVGLIKPDTLSTFGKSLSDLAKKVVDDFTGKLTASDLTSKVKKAGEELVTSLITGLKSKADEMNKAASNLASNAAKKIATTGKGGNKTAFTNAGKDLAQGLINGLKDKDKRDAVYQAAFSLGQLAVKGEKEGQESNSPSKATERAGKWLGEGLIIGMNKMGNRVYSAGSNIGKTATRTISSAIESIKDRFNSDIDTQPTIRPVLDLSDVTSGAGAISGLFNNQSVGVMANVNSISSMMSNRQNGGNDDVITAINKLRGEIGKNGGPTYNINGVSYDGSSGVAEAIETIARAALRERRS